jgi:hypothetical protein
MSKPILLQGMSPSAFPNRYQEIITIDSKLHAWLLESGAQAYIDTEDRMYYLVEDVKKAESERQCWNDRRKAAK